MTSPRVIALLLLAAVAPPLRAEFPLSQPTAGPRIGTKQTPAIVRVDAGYVVVWGENSEPGSGPDRLAASLIGADGEFVRSLGSIPVELELPLSPLRIAANAERVIVAVDCAPHSLNRAICVTSIEMEGSIGQWVRLEEGAFAPSIAWNGEEFLLTYVHRSGSDWILRARRIDSSGRIGEPFMIGPFSHFSQTPSVAAAGDSFYVAWHPSLHESLLTEIHRGEVRSSVDLGVSQAELGTTPQLSLGVFEDEIAVVSDSSIRLYHGLEPVIPWLPLRESLDPIHHPRPIHTADGWAIVFGDDVDGYSQVRSVSITHEGVRGDETLLGDAITPRWFMGFDAAPSDDGFILVWAAERSPYPGHPHENDVVIRIFDGSGSPSTQPRIASIGTASQGSPVAAWGGGAFLVAWRERTDQWWSVRARLFTIDGEPLGPPLMVPESNRDQIHPAVAFNGESFLLIWSEGPNGRSAVRGARITSGGAVLDVTPIEIAGAVPVPPTWYALAPRSADVAWSGSTWIVASEGDEELEVRRLTPNGVLMDPIPLIVEPDGELERMPVVDCAVGGDCLLAWQSYSRDGCAVTCGQPDDSVAALRISNDLDLLDEALVWITYRTRPYGRNLDVAWNETQRAWMIVWAGPSGRRVSDEGVVLDVPMLDYYPEWGRSSSVIADGDLWRVLWSGDTPRGRGVLGGWTRDSFENGGLRDRFLLAEPADDDLEVTLAAGPRILALYVQEHPSLGGAERISGDFVDEAQPIRRARPVSRAGRQ